MFGIFIFLTGLNCGVDLGKGMVDRVRFLGGTGWCYVWDLGIFGLSCYYGLNNSSRIRLVYFGFRIKD